MTGTRWQRAVWGLAVGLSLLSGAVCAEGLGPSPGVEPPEVPIALREADERRQVFEPRGAYIGAMRLDLSAGVALTHDDNLYNQSGAGVAAFLAEGRLDGTLRASNDTYTLAVAGEAATVHVPGHPDLDHQTGGVRGELSWQALNRSRLTVDGGWWRRVELPGDPALVTAAARPVLLDDWQAGMEMVLRRGLWVLGGESSLRRLDYHDGRMRSGRPLEQDDRDRWESEGMVRAGMAPLPTLDLYVGMEQSIRLYDDLDPVLGLQRDSMTVTQWLGVSWERSERLALDIAVGRAQRRYASPWFPDAAHGVWRGAATFAVTPLTTLSGGAWQRLEETAATSYSGVLARGWQGEVQHEVLRNLMLRALWRTETRTFEGLGPERRDRHRRFGLEGTWALDGRWGLAAEATVLRTGSTIPELDTRRRRITLRLSAAL